MSAISKPASQCTLTHLVVLHPIQGEDLCVSVDDWLSSNKIGNGRGCKYIDDDEANNNNNNNQHENEKENEETTAANDHHAEVHNIVFDDEFGGAEHLGIDHGDDGWNKMLRSDDVDAVYIVLPPR